MTTETTIQNRLGQPLRLAVLDRNSTKIAGCIGFEDHSGPIAGFALPIVSKDKSVIFIRGYGPGDVV